MKSAAHFAWIDFLRGISAVAVVIFHVRIELWIGWVAIHTHPESFSLFDRAVALLSIPLPFLGSVVMLFFIISGFCIHYPYAAEGRVLELKQYGIRRFLRIFPPYFAAVVLVILLEWFLSNYFREEVSSRLVGLKTLFMVQNYGSNALQMSANPSFWSLPVEVELYLVYPLFYWLLRRYGLKWAMCSVSAVSLGALVVSLKTSLYETGLHPWHFPIYWIIWCAGALLAEWVRQEKVPIWQPWLWLVMASTFIMAIVIDLLGFSVELQSLSWASFYFMVILWGLAQKEPLRFLNPKIQKIFVFLGLISYSLYLIHYPFFKLCGVIWINIFGSKPANLLIPFGFSVLSIFIAYAFYRLFEAPSHKLAKILASRRASTRLP
jgi:peptidoglycan/LPS O-acetylase OafA/YrhL